MNYEKIIQRLGEIKDEITSLKSLNFEEGRKKLYKFDDELRMIVRRIYPTYEKVEIRLFPVHPRIAHDNPQLHQEEFLQEADDLIDVTDTIKREFDLFGFEDFTPVKEKVETEFGLNKGKPSWFRKKTKENR